MDVVILILICLTQGIDRTMDDKLLYYPNDDKRNYPFNQTNFFKSLDTDRWEPTNQNLLKSSKVLMLMNEITEF